MEWAAALAVAYPWKVAMMLILPFMRDPKTRKSWIKGRPMLRTWIALFAASLSTFIVHTPMGYLVVDLIAAAIVVARPASLPQKAIGAMFVCMVLFDLGFYVSPQADTNLFRAVLTGIGWVQWLILGAWAGHDLFGRYSKWNSAVGRPPTVAQRRV